MNALYIEELARRTHRGLEGRVLEGNSGGGLCYGYRPVRQLLPNGEVERGDREIVAEEAAVIERIFKDYLSGMSTSEIAASLNADGTPGPRGGPWDKSAIHGNPKRGTGILNNELYIGRLIWNRQKFVKDPDTGKRQAMPNPPSEWKTADVPHLQIIDDALWEAVRARQSARSNNLTQRPAWERRKPKFLLTGLVKCGSYGRGFSTISRDHFGCSNARNKGAAYCTNRRHLHRDELEGRILTLLSKHLMEPDLVKTSSRNMWPR